MEISLYQARRLEDTLKNLTIGGQFAEVRAYDEDIAKADILEGVEYLLAEVDYSLAVNKIRFKIKHLINEANMQCGVSNLLCKREGLYEDIKVLGTLSTSWDTTARQVEYIKNNPSDIRSVSMVRESVVAEVYETSDSIKAEISKIKSTLIDLNNNNKIIIPAADVTFLQENDLI